MRKRKQHLKQKTGFPALILFLCGFLLGTLLPNILWRIEWKQKMMASVYLLENFANRSVSGREYLLELLRIRGSNYLLFAICSFSVFGVPLAWGETLLLGGKIGALLAMSILQFGLNGGIVGLGLLLPQYLVYVPVLLIVMSWMYELSMGMWNNRGLYPQKIGKYMGRFALGALIYGGGIVMECYLNPWIIEKVLDAIDLF